MNIWLTILLIVLIILYFIVRIIRPAPVRLSRFEIERRVDAGDARALVMRDRSRALPFLWALWWFASVTLLTGIAVTLTGLIGAGAFIVTVVLVMVLAWCERAAFIKKLGNRLFTRIEPRLIRLYAARKFFFFLPTNKPRLDKRIDSEAELLHLLDTATFLESERRTLIHAALEFTGLSVSDAMSGRRSIKAVDKGEVLGPLLLDELYKTGKKAFVVIDGDLDTVVGILQLERLTSLDMKDSPTAINAMNPEVHFIDADAPITDALGYLRSSKTPFLVVQDNEGITIGLLTMDNILRCLFAQE